MVALPLVALGVQAAQPGLGAFWEALSDPFAWHALKLTFLTALIMVLDQRGDGHGDGLGPGPLRLPGQGLVNALIDLPFAVPTVVTGLMLVVLYGPSSVLGTVLGRFGWGVIYQQPGIVLALLFVTYPFVIRSVQPVLLEMDRAEEEAAATLGAGAFTTFRRVTLPTLWPSILTGSAPLLQPGPGRVRQRGHGRGQPPAGDQDRPLYIFGEIESGNRHGALVVSAVLLASSLVILIGLNALPAQMGGRPWRLI